MSRKTSPQSKKIKSSTKSDFQTKKLSQLFKKEEEVDNYMNYKQKQ